MKLISIVLLCLTSCAHAQLKAKPKLVSTITGKKAVPGNSPNSSPKIQFNPTIQYFENHYECQCSQRAKVGDRAR